MSGRWVSGLAPIPTPRGGLAAAGVGDEIVAIGGETPSGIPGPAHAEVESYDPQADSWRSLAAMPVGRHGIQAAVLDGAVWLAGGANREVLAPVADHAAMIPRFPPATISSLRIVPARFRPAAGGAMISTRGGGARVSFTADHETRVSVTVTGPRGLRGTVRRTVPAGPTTVRLTGRLRGRSLRPGRYRFELRADGAAALRAAFRIRALPAVHRHA